MDVQNVRHTQQQRNVKRHPVQVATITQLNVRPPLEVDQGTILIHQRPVELAHTADTVIPTSASKDQTGMQANYHEIVVIRLRSCTAC